jgi:hypothetical protein
VADVGEDLALQLVELLGRGVKTFELVIGAPQLAIGLVELPPFFKRRKLSARLFASHRHQRWYDFEQQLPRHAPRSLAAA